jgi:hypothetical protein
MYAILGLIKRMVHISGIDSLFEYQTNIKAIKNPSICHLFYRYAEFPDNATNSGPGEQTPRSDGSESV